MHRCLAPGFQLVVSDKFFKYCVQIATETTAEQTTLPLLVQDQSNGFLAAFFLDFIRDTGIQENIHLRYLGRR